MNIRPVISEKSLNLAKSGRYTFRVDKHLNKFEIKNLIERMFSVHIINIATITESGEKKRTMTGRKRIILPAKKAVVQLKDKEKIDIFEKKE